MDELMELERQGWTALATSRDAAVAFYGEHLAPEAVMVFPGGLWLDGRDAILSAIDAQPWETYELSACRELALAGDAQGLVYRAEAWRAGGGAYAALVTSVYVRRDGDWRLAHHQQTPE